MLSILIVYVLLILFKENKILQKIFTQKIEERFLFTSSVVVFFWFILRWTNALRWTFTWVF